MEILREEDLRAVVGDNKTSMKISVMADVGRTDYSKDILEKKDSVIDMVRIAAYAEQMGEAMEMGKHPAKSAAMKHR